MSGLKGWAGLVGVEIILSAMCVVFFWLVFRVLFGAEIARTMAILLVLPTLIVASYAIRHAAADRAAPPR